MKGMVECREISRDEVGRIVGYGQDQHIRLNRGRYYMYVLQFNGNLVVPHSIASRKKKKKVKPSAAAVGKMGE